ncbi:zinc finger protein 37 homolog [Lutzomyia longipalpis]|uniref:zinc finger protein 37 homolog n=1 Tax=Lutzomyia longipalpis TaxID=7200 RepID=UPI0024839753|nr:zinc finger protein 37 homolog [Lutzomyia longipalpis]
MDEWEESVSGTCRTCLEKSKLMQSLYKVTEISERKEELSVFFKELTNLQCFKEDGLPVFICQECVQKISNAISFKAMCLNSDNILRGRSAVKIENVFVEETQLWEEGQGQSQAQNSTATGIAGNAMKDENYIFKNEPPEVEGVSGETESEERSEGTTKRKNRRKQNLSELSYNCTDWTPFADNQTDRRDIPTISKLEAMVEIFEDKKDIKWTPPGTKSAKKTTKFNMQPKAETKRNLSGGKSSNQKKNVTSIMCNLCGKVLKSTSLRIHMTTHLPEANYECSHCGKRYKNKQSLKTHIMVHRSDNPFKCNICGKCFSANTPFQVHLRNHKGEKPYLCPICGKSVTQYSGLTRHLQTHSEAKPYVCQICKKTFKTRGNLYDHSRTHVKESLFECSECDKKFKSKQTLKGHIFIHTKLRPYECSFCQKRFNAPHILRRHIYLHTGEKKYKCTLCPMGYIQREGLIRHMATHKQKEQNESLDKKPLEGIFE